MSLRNSSQNCNTKLVLINMMSHIVNTREKVLSGQINGLSKHTLHVGKQNLNLFLSGCDLVG